MSGRKNRRSKIREFSAAVVFFIVLCAGAAMNIASAAELIDRSVIVSTSLPSTAATHSFTFTTGGVSTVGSIAFEYCSNSPIHEDPCTAPAGLNAGSFSLATQGGITGFSVSGATTANQAVITKTPASHPATATSYALSNVINPSVVQQPTYIRISVYDGQNATGTRVDRGSVVFVTETSYDVSAFVPPYLTFCVGVTVALNCSTTQGSLVGFGELLDSATAIATTQFSVATNDGEGYSTFVGGQTMTSGNNVISALSGQAPSQIGVAQFGLNLKANSVPAVGAEAQGEVVSSGFASVNYNQSNLYRFVNGEKVAESPRSTGFNRYTVSYIVNVPEQQEAGVYATTLSYTTVASF